MPDDKPVNRRRFFREGLRELLKPLAGAVEPLEQAIKHLNSLDRMAPVTHKALTILRPPGAIAERSFLETCSRCEKCVKVCPAQCIKIDFSGAIGDRAPYIDPNIMPCVVCDGLVCMSECPSGALVPTALGLIDMGTAVWDSQRCIRSHGEECTICIDKCPVGEVAIELREGLVHVIEEGCIGCGVCQHECPTGPKSIVVMPRPFRG